MTSITRNTVAKLICKFKKAGNFAGQPRSGPRCRADASALYSTALMRVHQHWKIRIKMCIQNSGIHMEHII